MRVTHTFEPVYNSNSRVLILGTFPSVKSREGNFYYHHPQNRFWKLIAALVGKPVPETIAQKIELLLRSGIAVWDVVAECDITGSSDASIRNVVPTDINRILDAADIVQIYANGAKAAQLYHKYLEPMTGRPARKLPSTSPANAAYSFERLKEEWRAAFRYVG